MLKCWVFWSWLNILNYFVCQIQRFWLTNYFFGCFLLHKQTSRLTLIAIQQAPSLRNALLLVTKSLRKQNVDQRFRHSCPKNTMESREKYTYIHHFISQSYFLFFNSFAKGADVNCQWYGERGLAPATTCKGIGRLFG